MDREFDNAAATDPTDRTAAALEEWNEPEETHEPVPAADQTAGDGAAGAAKPGDKPADKPADKAADKPAEGEKDITKAPFFADPLFQEHYKQAEDWRTQNDALHKVMDEGRYTIKDTATLKAVHEDAFTLYDIAAGKKTVDGLLDLFEKNWDQKVFQDVLGQMARYAAKKGISLDGAERTADDDNPLAKTVKELSGKIEKREAEEKTAREREASERQVKERMDTVIAPFQKKVEELCKGKGLTDQTDIEDYAVQVMDRIGRLDEKKKAAVVEQIKAGKWGEVERLFTEYHNLLVQRATRHANAVADAAKKNASTIPRTPTGDGGAPKKRTQGRDLSTSEGRTAAAMENWNKQ